MTHWRCLLLGHDIKRITDWLPVSRSAEGWDDDVDILALGECKRPGCGKREVRHVYGRHSYGAGTGKYQVTLAQAHVKWQEELADQAAFEAKERERHA
jgi:hypothetical protein